MIEPGFYGCTWYKGLPAEYLLLAVPWVNSTETLSRGASVTLFVQCTQAMLPGFQLTDENARDIAGICSLLEGVRRNEYLRWQQLLNLTLNGWPTLKLLAGEHIMIISG